MYRHYSFINDNGSMIGFIYHYESLWVACWLPWSIKDQCFTHRDSIGQNYIYGFSFTHRDNTSTITKVGTSFCGGFYINKQATMGEMARRVKHLQHLQQTLDSKQIVKSKFLFKQVFVTESMVSNGFLEEPWSSPAIESDVTSWHEKNGNIKQVVKSWKIELGKRILQWNRSCSSGYYSSDDFFERIKGNNNSLHYLFKIQYETQLKTLLGRDQSNAHYRSNGRNWYDENGRIREQNRQKLIKNIIPDDFVPDYESVLKIYKDLTEYEILFQYNFFNKKFIRRIITEACNKINASFEVSNNILATPEERNMEKIMGPILKLDKYFKHVTFIYKIWQDQVPFDHLQNINLLSSVEIPNDSYYQDLCNLYKWLKINMPISTYIQLIDTHYKAQIDDWNEKHENSSYTYNKDRNYNKFVEVYDMRFSDLNDSINMLTGLIKQHGIDFKKPKRWRIAEFHDYVTAESWKLRNENEKLPQDLFPKPIKVTLDLNGALNIVQMTFFQPKDTHQLAEYSERIRKKKNFIVLAMIENKPRYTIQLSLDRGILHVDQIADVSNALLDDQQRNNTEKLFKEALKIRDNQ